MRGLPCTLWFLDRGKAATDRADKTLFLDARHIFRQLDRAHRDWTDSQIGFMANIVRLYRREEIDVTLGGPETESKLLEMFGKKPKYRDILGLCRVVTATEILKESWSLNPGRYVGNAPGESLGDADFRTRIEELTEEFDALCQRASTLQTEIARNIATVLGDSQ